MCVYIYIYIYIYGALQKRAQEKRVHFIFNWSGTWATLLGTKERGFCTSHSLFQNYLNFFSFLNNKREKKVWAKLFGFFMTVSNVWDREWGVVTHENWGGCPRGVMVKAMDCGIVVREFVLQSHYYVHFRANTLGKGMNPLILPAMG